MKLLGRFIAMALMAVVGIAASNTAAQAATTPILVKSCTMARPAPLSHRPRGVSITYVNLGHRTAAQVTFAIGYRNAAGHWIRRVIDVGEFAPGATISHTLNAFTDVTYSGSETTLCVPIEVKYAGGTVWMAPSRPAGTP